MRWNYRLKTLMVLVAAVAVCAWLTIELRPILIQRAAKRRIRQLGGEITHFRQTTGASLSDIESINLIGTSTTDADLNVLVDMHRLRFLSLGFTKISDNGLRTVAALSSLEGLGVEGTSITDNGILHIAMLSSLKELDLEGTHITDSCIQDLCALKQLRILNIKRTKITSDGILELAIGIPQCKVQWYEIK